MSSNFSRNKEGNTDDGTKKERIGLIDNATLSYYRQVLVSIEEGFESDEEKENFLTNVCEQYSREFLQVSRNQTVSAICERFIVSTSQSQFEGIITQFAADASTWETLSTDRFASHVLQTAIRRASHFVENSETVRAALHTLLSDRVGMTAETFAHVYASHVVRALIESVSGNGVSNEVIKSRLSRGNQKATTLAVTPHKKYKEYKAAVLKLSSVLFTHDLAALHALAKDASCNPLMQTVLLVLSKKSPDECRRLCHQLALESGIMDKLDGDLPAMFTNEIASYLMEVMASTMSETDFEDIWTRYIAPNARDMMCHPVANFVLQKTIGALKNKKQFYKLLKTFDGFYGDVLARERAGVIVAILHKAAEFPKKQADLVETLMEAFQCSEPKERRSECAQLFVTMTSYNSAHASTETPEDNDDTPSKDPVVLRVTHLGSMLVQRLLVFEQPEFIARSILDMPPPQLLELAASASGSYVFNAFMDSATVSSELKDSLWEALEAVVSRLCCDKFGSRVLELVWNKGDIERRKAIADRLTKEKSLMKGNLSGKILTSKFGLYLYPHRMQVWMDMQTKSLKKPSAVVMSKKAQPANDISLNTKSKKKRKRQPAVEAQLPSGGPPPGKRKKKKVAVE